MSSTKDPKSEWSKPGLAASSPDIDIEYDPTPQATKPVDELDKILTKFSQARDYPALNYEESKLEATNAIKALLTEARIDGIDTVERIGRERLENDDEYTLDAYLQDMRTYAAQLKNERSNK